MMIKITDLKAGDNAIEIDLLVTGVVTGKTNGANRQAYLSLVLQDDSGTIDAKLWQVTNEQIETITAGKIVRVKADVIKYNEDRQMKIVAITVVSDKVEDQVKYLKKAPIDADILIQQIKDIIHSFENQKIKDIVLTIFEKNQESIRIYPAASKNHHEYVSGLVHHTVGMLNVANALCVLYSTLNRDLLFAGVILHDLGKIIELSGPVIPEYTLKGKLLGHISICQAMIKQTADELGIDDEVVTLLQHMVLSHHGKNEYGSPVLPLLKEAEMLTLVDNIDARMNMLDKALDLVEPGEFTKRVFSLEQRSFYKPKAI